MSSKRYNVTEQYFNSAENGFFPMSTTDVEIVETIMETIELQDPKLFHILKQYKLNKSDVDVLKLLQAHRSKVLSEPRSKEDNNEQENEFKIVFLNIQDEELCKLYQIKNIKKGQRYDEANFEMMYLITINYSQEGEGVFGCSEFKFKKESIRDKEFQKIKDQLISMEIIIIE